MKKVFQFQSNMEDDASYQEPLCARGCGSYGYRGTRNLCCNCFLETVNEQLDSFISSKDPSFRTYLENLPPLLGKRSRCFSEGSAAAVENNNTPSKKKKKNRCVWCNKNVGVLGFGCRCGGSFCGVHRYPETHECKFDYKSVGRAAIAEQNPLVKADKMANRI